MQLKDNLPAIPYIGLQYFRPEDHALFSGRDSDVEICGRLLASMETRMVLLHGVTGCGKSSFIRAGLIPALERHELSYHFLRDGNGTPILIRSGADPIARIAEAVYTYAQSSVCLETALGATYFDLSAARLGEVTVGDFVERCRRPEGLMNSLRNLYKAFPFTLILVVDQAEEVITLADPGRERLRQFIDFVKDFSIGNFPVKCIVSLRKDYSGEFIGLAQMRHSISFMSDLNRQVTKPLGSSTRVPTERSDIKIFLLRDLEQIEVLHAIELPTSPDAQEGFISPRAKYGFAYDPGVAAEICSDLFDATSSVLPVMQIVCRDLYNKVRTQPIRTLPTPITMKLYVDGGRVGGPVDRHITSSLLESFGSATQSMSDRERNAEVDRGRELLYGLVSRRPDGSVHSEQLSMRQMRELANRVGLKTGIGGVVEYLSRDDVLLLRSFALMSVADGEDRQFVSLGHDVIGLTLYDWKQRRLAEISTRRRILRQAAVATGIVICIAALIRIIAVKEQGVFQSGTSVGERRAAEKVMLASAGKQIGADPYMAVAMYSRALMDEQELAQDARSAAAEQKFSYAVKGAERKLVRLMAGLPDEFIEPIEAGVAETGGASVRATFAGLPKSGGLIRVRRNRIDVIRGGNVQKFALKFGGEVGSDSFTARTEFGDAESGTVIVLRQISESMATVFVLRNDGTSVGPLASDDFISLMKHPQAATEDIPKSISLVLGNETLVALGNAGSAGGRQIEGKTYVFALSDDGRPNPFRLVGDYSRLFQSNSKEVVVAYADDYLVTTEAAAGQKGSVGSSVTFTRDSVLTSYDLRLAHNHDPHRIVLSDNDQFRNCKTDNAKEPCGWRLVEAAVRTPMLVFGELGTVIPDSPPEGRGRSAFELENYRRLLFVDVASRKTLVVDNEAVIAAAGICDQEPVSTADRSPITGSFYVGSVDDLVLGYERGAEVQLMQIRNAAGTAERSCAGKLYVPYQVSSWYSGEAGARLRALGTSSAIGWSNFRSMKTREGELLNKQTKDRKAFLESACAIRDSKRGIAASDLERLTGIDSEILLACEVQTAGDGRK